MLKSIRALFLLVTASGLPASGNAQSALERHAWQEKRSFATYSRTAAAITGPVRLSGNDKFATEGSKMTLTFANGKQVGLTSLGGRWRQWSFLIDSKSTGEIFQLDRDPGPLLQGNTLCGDPKTSPARYIVFHDEKATLGMAVFSSLTPPSDINDKDLCGTFSYVR